MFESTQNILNQYVSDVSRYSIHSVEMERGENPEDLFFLVHADTRWFVVYETDYIDALKSLPEEAVTLFINTNIKPIHWLVKKDSQSVIGAESLALDAAIDDKENRSALVYKQATSPSRYAVLEVKLDTDTKRYNPNTYGGIS